MNMLSIRDIIGYIVLLLFTSISCARVVADPNVSPSVIRGDSTTQVLITVNIFSDAALPTSVSAQQLSNSGAVIKNLGYLTDTGTSGDARAADGIFSGYINLAGAVDNNAHLRVTAAIRGQIKREVSDVVTVRFVSSSVPLQPPTSSEYPPIVVRALDLPAEVDCDRLVVRTIPSAKSSDLEAIARRIAGARLGGPVLGVENHWVVLLPCAPGIAALDGASRSLSQDTNVEFVEYSDYLEKNSVVSDCVGEDCVREQWGNQMLRIQEVYDQFLPLKPVTIGIVDSGVAKAHPDLVVSDHVTAAPYSYIPGLASGDGNPDGHGTQVAGIIGASIGNHLGIDGACPNCVLISGKVPTFFGAKFSTSEVVDVIDKLVSRGARIINLSMGSAYRNSTMARAVERATSRGTLIIASAGNNGCDKPYFPASLPGVLSVGAIDWLGRQSVWFASADLCSPGDDYSNFGSDWVSIWAPGGSGALDGYKDVITTHPGGMYDRGFGGTSAAAPYVTAIAGLTLGHTSKISPGILSTLLQQSAVYTQQKDSFGHPIWRVDALAAVTAPVPKFAIDGDSRDWSTLPWFWTYEERTGTPGAIIRWKIASDKNFLYLLREISLPKDWSGYRGYPGGILFINADNNAATGCSITRGAEIHLLVMGPDMEWPDEGRSYNHGSVEAGTVANDSPQSCIGTPPHDPVRVVSKTIGAITELSLPLAYINRSANGSLRLNMSEFYSVSPVFKFR